MGAVAIAALVCIVPPYVLLASELREVRREIASMTSTITVTRDGGTTTYYLCTDVEISDNGTWTFKGRKGSDSAPEGTYSIGHGTYDEIEQLPTV